MVVDSPVVQVRGEAHREVPPELARFAAFAGGGGAGGGPPELELDPQPQTVQAAVQARFTINDPVLG